MPGDSYEIPNSRVGCVAFQYGVSNGVVHVDGLQYHLAFELTSDRTKYKRENDGGNITVTAISSETHITIFRLG